MIPPACKSCWERNALKNGDKNMDVKLMIDVLQLWDCSIKVLYRRLHVYRLACMLCGICRMLRALACNDAAG